MIVAQKNRGWRISEKEVAIQPTKTIPTTVSPHSDQGMMLIAESSHRRLGRYLAVPKHLAKPSRWRANIELILFKFTLDGSGAISLYSAGHL
jgi:hypothetical protein